jgi:TetR/AcrR family transcriptional regulator
MKTQLSRTERKRAAQRAELVAAARRALARAGIGGLTLDAVASEAGVSKPSVHYYFASKEALGAAVVVEVALEEIALFLEATKDARTFRDACDAAIAAFVERYESDFESFRVHYVWSQVFRSREPVLEALPRAAGPLLDRLEHLARADQLRGELASSFDARALVNVVAAVACGIIMRFALFEASGARVMVSLETVAREARLVMAAALTPPAGHPKVARPRRGKIRRIG